MPSRSNVRSLDQCARKAADRRDRLELEEEPDQGTKCWGEVQLRRDLGKIVEGWVWGKIPTKKNKVCRIASLCFVRFLRRRSVVLAVVS